MRFKTALVAVLALAFQAQGAPVSLFDAESAVRGWTAVGSHLGVRFGSSEVERSATHTTSNGNVFYSVKLKGGGTVFTSGDTGIEPIIAFTSATNDFSTIDSRSPLWALLNRDLSARRPEAGASALPQRSGGVRLLASAAPSAATSSEDKSASAKWHKFVNADPQANTRPLLSASPITPPAYPSDLRVAPLVQSKWNQTTNALGEATWNYYTPSGSEPPWNEGDPDNYPCGCVATMMAQIMRYHHGPVGKGGRGIPLPKVDTKTDFTNYVTTVDEGGEPVTTKFISKLQGGYDWDNMPLVADAIDEEQRQNIGKLTSDCGLSIGTDYSASGSGASSEEAVRKTLVEVFGYSQTEWTWPPEPDTSIADEKKREEDFAEKTAKFYQRTLYVNFDAGFPCCLSICKVTPADYDIVENNHAVIADGYGFEGEGDGKTPYVHLNMGWSGADDCWYNLPGIGTEFEFNTVYGVGYNIMPVEGGKFGEVWATNSIVSGRVLDDDMNPVAGCTVNICKSGTLDIVATVKSGANGIWAAILSNGVMEGLDMALYDVEAFTDDLTLYKKLDDVELGRDNSWGNDIVLERPSVRVGDRVFSKVDDGIAMARIKAEEGFVGWIPIEILDATWLKRCAQIDFNCVLFATNSAPRESAVTRLFDDDVERHAMLTVVDGFSLVMSNVVFTAEKGADTVVTVLSGGSLDIAGTIEFGVSYTNAAVKTADANCFRLLGAIDDYSGFTLSCESAKNAGDVLGFCRAETKAEFDAITNCASHIANYADNDGEIRAKVEDLDPTVSPYDYKLVWRKQQVPVEDAVAYFEDKDGKMTTAGSINALLGKYEDALQHDQLPPSGERTIHIQKDGTLSSPLAIGYGLSIVGDDVEVLVEESAGFTVAAGGNLSVSGISFSGYKGNALFLVNGDGASLDMTEVSFSNIEGTNKWSGAVTILKGSATMDDAIFTGCRATGTYVVRNNVIKTRSSYGGAIYVDTGATLNLRDSVIMDCSALRQGGAIYAESDAKVFLGGELWIFQNTNESEKNNLKNSDVYLKRASRFGGCATLELVDTVTGRVGVRWDRDDDTSDYGNTNGCLFAVADSAEMAEGSVDAFFNDLDSSLVARADGVALRWSEPPEGPQPLPQTSPGEVPEGAIAGVVSESGDVTKYYASVADAITVAKDGETVVVLVDATFSSDISVSANIALTSDGHTLTRTGDCSISIGSEASLTIGDIEIVGGSFETTTTRPIFDVSGGSLTLASGAKICDVNGDGARNAGAVSVGGGRFTMESGAEISNCINWYDNEAYGAGRGGALLVDSGEAVFTGGTVTGCMARNGGVFIGNGAVVKVSGDTVIAGNLNLQWKAKDLVVYDLSADKGYLLLDGELTGSIGYTEGVSGNTNVFGSVSAEVSDADALASAHRFTHDVTGDIGMAVKNGDSRLLVWSTALDDGGNYIDVETGDVYQLVDGEPAKIEFPTKKENLVYNGNLRTGVVESAGFTLVGNVATNAGLYTANATLRPGYVWEDGSSDPTDVQWSIAKAKYDMRYVSFPNRTFSYDGDWHAMAIEGALPDGVEVSYSENYRQRDVGVYNDVLASFTGDATNYEAIDDMVATLTISSVPEPTPPEDDPPEPTPPATPVPIDFSALASSDGTKWIISVTDAVAKCWYSLYETNSLVGGFKIDSVDPISRRQASDDDDPTMVFERPRTGEQLFWRVKAEAEDMYTYPDDEY